MPNHSQVAVASDDEEIVEIPSPSEMAQVNDAASDDSVELEMGSFIRIKSQGDGIFEDEDDDEFCDAFVPPDVEVGLPPTRKRKQEMTFRDSDDFTELIELNDEPEFQEGNFSMEPDIFQMRRRDRMPLYLLDPNDYAHDPKKQIQIRRAIITYRHHQEKKAQIVRLTEESRRLREQVETLKGKVLELARCGCPRNEKANLDILDLTVPVVPPRMYIRGNRPVLAAPYNNVQFSSDLIVTEHEKLSPYKLQSMKSTINSMATPIVNVPDVPKPLVNIGSSRLQQISSSTLSSVNVGSATSRPSHSHFTISGNRIIAGQGASRPTNFLRKGSFVTSVPGVPGKPDITAGLQIKSEPVSVSNQSAQPNTASASRIVFAKPNQNSSGGPQTASQLLFASKQNNVAVKTEPLNGQTRLLNTTITPVNSTNTAMPSLKPVSSMFRTASGQVLRVVQTPTARQSNILPGPSKTRYHPILPKLPPTPATEFNPTSYNSRITKEALKEMWTRFDDDDEDEMAIIAAINGTSVPPKNSRTQKNGNNSNVLRSNGTDIELDKYADIVFEEAD